jgi:hypothetical protein
MARAGKAAATPCAELASRPGLQRPVCLAVRLRLSLERLHQLHHERAYRTAPLKGLWTHTEGGFYHDGRFRTLREVIDHYDRTFGLRLGGGAKRDLIEFLKSL